MGGFVMDKHDKKRRRVMRYAIPESGLVRLPQIIGDPKADPPIPAIIPVSKSTWWAGVRSGRYPQPVKLGPRTTTWKIEEIRAMIDQQSAGND